MKRRSEVFECVTINSRVKKCFVAEPGGRVGPRWETVRAYNKADSNIGKQLSHLLNNDAGGGVAFFFNFTCTLRRKSKIRALSTSLPFRWNSWGRRRTGSHLRVFCGFSVGSIIHIFPLIIFSSAKVKSHWDFWYVHTCSLAQVRLNRREYYVAAF